MNGQKLSNTGYVYRRSLLYKSRTGYADYCLNHIEGCSHGCRYPCYAFINRKKAGHIKTYKEWRQPKIVLNALDILDKEIPEYKGKIRSVYLCFSTDGFMFKNKDVRDLSLKVIDKLNENRIPCIVLTKGILPKELADRNSFSRNNEYGITLVSLEEDFRKQFEPNTASLKDRISSLKYLHKKGYKTWVSMLPYPPPSIIKQDLNRILKAVSFVNKIFFGKLNYVQSQKFKYPKGFFKCQAQMVIEFCEKNKIECHIE